MPVCTSFKPTSEHEVGILDQAVSCGRDEEMAVLQDQFSANVPAYLDRIAEHLRTKNWSSLQGEAHALKGAAGTLGFTELSDLAGLLEQNLKDGSLESVELEVAKLVEHATTMFSA